MAKISELPLAGPIDGTETFLLVQQGETVRGGIGRVVEAGLKAVLTPQLDSFDRYLDTVTGNDANNGLSPTTPKRTLAAVLALGSIVAGCAIGIARGSRLAATMLTGDNIRIGSFGALGTPPPVFDPSILLPAAAWAALGGHAGVWSQTVGGGYVDADLKNIGNVVWLDQASGQYVVLKQYASLAALDAAASGVYVAGWNTANLTVSLKPGAFGSPLTSGQEYRVTNGYPLRILGDYQAVSDVAVRNAAEQNGCIDLYGNHATARRISALNGSRHNALFGRDAVVEDCYFGGGDNQLEAGQGPNGAVFYHPDFAGASFTVRRCTFEDTDGNGMQPIYSHDSAPTGAPLPALVEDCIFIGCNVPCEIGLTGGFLNLVRPQFKNSRAGRVCTEIGRRSLDCHFASGSVNMLSDSGTGALSFFDSDLTFPSLGDDRRQCAVWYPGAAGGPTVRIIRGTYRVNPKIVGYSGHGTAIASLNSGSFEARGATFKIDGLVLGHDLTHGWELGFAGGAAAVSGGNNRWPFGVKFARNGTTYANLAAAQAAGYEAGSTTEPVPAALLTFDPVAVADGNLEGVAGWTKIAGPYGVSPAGSFVIAGHKVRSALAANAGYHFGDMPAVGGYCSFKVEGFGDYVFVTMKMTAAGDCFLGCEIRDGGHPAFFYKTPITLNRATSGPVIAVGDIVTFVVRVKDAATGLMGLWVYVNDALVSAAELTDPTIAASTGVGVASIGYNAPGLLASDMRWGPLG